MSFKFVPVVLCLASLLVVADAGAAKSPKKAAKGAPAPTAKIYKWVDENGVTHYGEYIPSQYRDVSATQMTNRGVTVRRIDGSLTEEQRRAAQARAEREREEQKRKAARHRRDIALLATYTSEQEIEAARERTLVLPNQAIRGLQPQLKHAQERLERLEGQAERLREAGRQVPPQLSEEIDLQRQVAGEIRRDIDRYRAEIQTIQQRFREDKVRFVELTGVAHP